MFNQANLGCHLRLDRLRQAASVRADEVTGKDQLRVAMADVDRKCEAVTALANRIMETRACTPAGILLKMRVGEEWAMDDDWGQDEET